MDRVKVTASVKKTKKKQVKEEVDRIKQAEKKKRRLEKALATSAAIRSELEKKKLKKKEEQNRLDDEGAAIAEAVALHVLLGEDSDDLKKKDEELASCDHASNTAFLMGPTQPRNYNPSKYSFENLGSISDDNQCGQMWNFWGNSNLTASADHQGSGFCPQYFGGVWNSAGHLAVSTLESADHHALVFNPFVRG